jgi:hypothetical protein
LLRQAYAILATFEPPNVREIAKIAISPNDGSVLHLRSNDLSLSTPVPPPGPVVSVEPEIPRIPPAPELDE